MDCRQNVILAATAWLWRGCAAWIYFLNGLSEFLARLKPCPFKTLRIHGTRLCASRGGLIFSAGLEAVGGYMAGAASSVVEEAACDCAPEGKRRLWGG